MFGSSHIVFLTRGVQLFMLLFFIGLFVLYMQVTHLREEVKLIRSQMTDFVGTNEFFAVVDGIIDDRLQTLFNGSSKVTTVSS